MKTHQEVLLEFMLAISPTVMGYYEQEGKEWNENFENDFLESEPSRRIYIERIFSVAVDLTAKYFNVEDHELDIVQWNKYRE
jgi:hypothetical protein